MTAIVIAGGAIAATPITGTVVGVSTSARLPCEPESVGRARHFVVDELRHHGVDRWPAELLVSELVTNVICHAGTEFEVEVHVDGVVRVTITDESPVPPRPVTASDELAEGGRGLQLVDALAQRWGVDTSAGGKLVWFELPSSG